MASSGVFQPDRRMARGCPMGLRNKVLLGENGDSGRRKKLQIIVTEKDLFSFAAQNGRARTNLRAAKLKRSLGELNCRERGLWDMRFECRE
jgi:hypothetical protein